MYTLIVMLWLGAVDAEAYTQEFDTLDECNEERTSIENMLVRFSEDQEDGKFYWIVGDCVLTSDGPS